MFKSFFKSVAFGLKVAFAVGVIAALVVFFSAPVLFGITFLTAAAVGAIIVYGIVSFIITFLAHFFGIKWLQSRTQDASASKTN
jgi:hypothetical protein